MATYGWRQDRSVADALFEDAHLFGFHQAMRILEALDGERVPVAEGVDHERETVRFRSSIRFDFPASEVEEIRRSDDGRPEMTVNIMGLAGVLGPLPPWVSERAIERSTRGDGALAEFLDLFNHRLLSLLYRAQKKYRPALDSRPPDRGRVANVLFSLIGLGTPHLRGAMGVSERALLPFAGILSARPRSMVGLEMLVAGYFDVHATVVPFRGLWNDIDESEVTRIGARGANQILGESAVLGTRAWDPEASFELRLGPLTLKQFVDFLPRHVCHRALVSLVRFYAGEELGFTYRLMIEAGEVPELRLGHRNGAMLGWTSWLKSKPFERDDAQVAVMGRA